MTFEKKNILVKQSGILIDYNTGSQYFWTLFSFVDRVTGKSNFQTARAVADIIA